MDIEGNFALFDTKNRELDAEDIACGAPPLKELVRAALAQCQQRRRILPELMLEDPRWLMALDLLLGVAEGRAVTVTNLAIAAEVPFTTALRHINAMVNEGLVHRVDHPTDRRVVFVALSPALHEQLVDYLRTIYGLAERLRAIGAAARSRLETPAANNDERPSPAVSLPASPSLPGWECVARTNGRFTSTILTRNDVSIALVFPESEGRRPDGFTIHQASELLPEMALD